MSSLDVKRIALVVPNRAADDTQPAPTCSTSAATADEEGRLLVIANPLDAQAEVCTFSFDRIDSVQAGCPLHPPLDDSSQGLTEHRREALCVLLHGAVSSLSMKRLFRETVERLVRQVVVGSDAEASSQAATPEADAVSFSVLRAYSWGTTDVLRRALVEQTISTPSHSSHAAHSATALGASDGADNEGDGGVLYRPLRRDRFEEHEVPLLNQVLRETLRVPDGHSAVRFVLVKRCRSDGTTRTFTVGLLPSLQRANHLFRDDLLNLRDAFQGRLDLQDGDRLGRLANLFLDISPETANHLRVVTVVDGATPYSEANLLQCWYGSRTASRPTPMWTPAPSSGGATGPDRGADLNEAFSRSFESATPPPRRLFPMDSEATPRAVVSESHACDGRTLSESVRSQRLPRSPLTSAAQSPGAERAGDPLALFRESDTPPSPTLAAPQPRQCTGNGSSSRGESVLDSDVADLRQERDSLEKDKAKLLDDIRSLEAYKAVLEETVGQFFVSIGQDVLRELEDAESAMLTEVNRAQTILGVTQASSLSQEQQLLSRLALLTAELTQGVTPPERLTKTTPRRQ